MRRAVLLLLLSRFYFYLWLSAICVIFSINFPCVYLSLLYFPPNLGIFQPLYLWIFFFLFYHLSCWDSSYMYWFISYYLVRYSDHFISVFLLFYFGLGSFLSLHLQFYWLFPYHLHFVVVLIWGCFISVTVLFRSGVSFFFFFFGFPFSLEISSVFTH